MRHRVAGRKLNRSCQHRVALRRNMVASLFEHETISTTMEKAKEVKSFAEKLITLAKKGTLHDRRRAISLLGNRDILVDEEGAMTKSGTVIGKLFSDIGPRYLDRPGGYTRIIRLAQRRLGDNGKLVLLQLVGKDDKREVHKSKRSKKEDAPVVTSEEPKEELEVQPAEAPADVVETTEANVSEEASQEDTPKEQ